MKRILGFFILLAVTLSVVFSSSACSPEYSVENFTVYDKDMKAVELEDYIGKPIVLNFWATWCYYCTKEMPDFNEAYKNHSDVQFMMINYTDGKNETVEKAMDYIESEGYEFPVFFDTKLEAAEKYGVEAFPTTFFISAEGDLVQTHRGAMSAKKLAEYLELISE